MTEPRTLRGLKTEATRRANAGGHKLAPWHPTSDIGTWSYTRCTLCHGSVIVDVKSKTGSSGAAASTTCAAWSNLTKIDYRAPLVSEKEEPTQEHAVEVAVEGLNAYIGPDGHPFRRLFYDEATALEYRDQLLSDGFRGVELRSLSI